MMIIRSNIDFMKLLFELFNSELVITVLQRLIDRQLAGEFATIILGFLFLFLDLCRFGVIFIS